MPEQPTPEPRTVKDCAQLQKECRAEMFGHINDKHTETQTLVNTNHGLVMGKLNDIDKKFAYQEGVENGRAAAETNNNPPVVAVQPKTGTGLKDIFIKLGVTWGPPALFLLILGAISWLKSKGWL